MENGRRREPVRAFSLAVYTLVRKPFIILFFGILSLAYLAVNSLNPVLPLLSGLSRITSGNIFDSIISLLQILIEPRIIGMVAVFIFAISFVLAIAGGLLLSGFFNVIYKSLDNLSSTRGQFVSGMKKHFLRISLATFFILFFGLILLVIAAVVSVPAIVITKAVLEGKPDFLLAAVFVDVLTAGVLFLGSMFFRAYMFFWYPAVIEGAKKPFLKSKRMVDRHFWGILARFLVFDLVFAAFSYATSFLDMQILPFFLDWIFGTLFFVTYLTYIFSLYKAWTHAC